MVFFFTVWILKRIGVQLSLNSGLWRAWLPNRLLGNARLWGERQTCNEQTGDALQPVSVLWIKPHFIFSPSTRIVHTHHACMHDKNEKAQRYAVWNFVKVGEMLLVPSQKWQHEKTSQFESFLHDQESCSYIDMRYDRIEKGLAAEHICLILWHFKVHWCFVWQVAFL